MRNNWRVSLMLAAVVIPAPVAYIKVVNFSNRDFILYA